MVIKGKKSERCRGLGLFSRAEIRLLPSAASDTGCSKEIPVRCEEKLHGESGQTGMGHRDHVVDICGVIQNLTGQNPWAVWSEHLYEPNNL